MTPTEEALQYYSANYDLLGNWVLVPGQKTMLGDKTNRKCRFCGKSSPDVTFQKVAHALPELLGNKSLSTAYECDSCNAAFGEGIETQFGYWSKPMRTFARIRGKSGVPTLVKGSNGGWRIEHGATGFSIKAYEDDPIFDFDEVNNRIHFTLKRDTYTPIAVLKSFVKMGLTLLPDDEMPHFQHALDWIKNPDHTARFVSDFPVLYAFQPGPLPNDRIGVLLFRRKAAVASVPYATLILVYGNELFQVFLPSPTKDAAIHGTKVTLTRFLFPGAETYKHYGATRYDQLDFTGTSPVKGEVFKLTLAYALKEGRSAGGP